jgi:hypothetical protein
VVTYNVSQADAPDVDPVVLSVCLIQTKRIPEKINIPRGPGNQSPQHQRAKERLVEIALQSGYEFVCAEVEQQKIRIPLLGERSYTPDLIFQKGGKFYILEADGKKGHTSRRSKDKDKLRDKVFGDRGIRTLRVKVKDLIGRKKQADQDIIRDLEWQRTAKLILRL